MKIRKIIKVPLYVVLGIILSIISLYLLLLYLLKPGLSEVSYTLDGYQYRVMAIYDRSDDQYTPYDFSLEIYLQNSSKYNCKEICLFFTKFINSDQTYSTADKRKLNPSNLRNKECRIFFYSDNVLKPYEINHERFARVVNNSIICDFSDTLNMSECISK